MGQHDIKTVLSNVETKHKISILYAVESGSRAWGFADTHSDWDVRFVYRRPVERYFSTDPTDNTGSDRDVIRPPIEEKMDIEGWDIHKTLGLLAKLNGTLLEWLHSPIVYRDTGIAAPMRKAMNEFWSVKPVAHHYLGWCDRQRKRYFSSANVDRKKYFYVLRPLLCLDWLQSERSFPPLAFTDILTHANLTTPVDTVIRQLFEDKISGVPMEEESRDAVLEEFIDDAYDRHKSWVSSLQDHVPEYTPTNRLLRGILGLQ